MHTEKMGCRQYRDPLEKEQRVNKKGLIHRMKELLLELRHRASEALPKELAWSNSD